MREVHLVLVLALSLTCWNLVDRSGILLVSTMGTLILTYYSILVVP